MTETTYTLDSVLDGAHLVKTRRLGPASVILAVWHGGHTVNVYAYDPARPEETIRAATCRSVGDFETGEVTEADAREAMIDELTRPTEEA